MDNSQKHGLIRQRGGQLNDQTLKNMIGIPDMSISMQSDELRQFLNNSTISQNRTMFQSVIYEENENLDLATVKQKTNQLYGHFLDILHVRTNDSEIFDTVKDLIQACSDTLIEISKPTAALRAAKCQSSKEVEAEQNWLTVERDTWRLLYALYKDRLIIQKDQNNDYDDLPLISSEKNIVEQLYTTNANLREYQLIVDWLEQSASEQVTNQIGFFTDRTIGWENTLLELKNVNQSIFGTGGKELVRSMDPDAPYREKLRLHDLDAEDQKRLSKQILLEIRKGRIEDAQTLCEHCGQPWQAAVLEGWRLHHDPNFDNIDPTIKQTIEGNPRRDLWKKLAWMMAEKMSIDECSRAVVGVLCGHLESILVPLGFSWEDLLWAYLKVQIDIRVESEIRSTCMKSYLEMPDKYWNGKMSLEQIFDEINAHDNINVRTACKNPINIIQKYLILDDIPEMMKNIDEWILEKRCDPQTLRFLTHLILFMRQIGRPHQETIADRVIRAYIECLIEMGEPQLVAFYTAAVLTDLQTVLYSKFLQTINETNQRKVALEEAINAGLDIQTITAHTVEFVRTKLLPSQQQNQPKQLEGVISEIDEKKISILEWLTFHPQHLGELLWQTNAMIRTFLAEQKIECVRKTFKMIPVDTISQIVNTFNVGGGGVSGGGGGGGGGGVGIDSANNNLPYKEECSIKEYLCYKTYLSAIDGYNDWTRLYHSKPKEPKLISENANFTERIASEHKEQAYRIDLERWKINLVEQTRISSELLYNVLLFPDKGYLIDPEPDTDLFDESIDSWDHRIVQLDSLRKICIPEIVLLLHKVLHFAGEYKECIRLADELVSEKRQLYLVYPKHKIAEIIGKISESSLALMNDKLDPWGYTLGS